MADSTAQSIINWMTSSSGVNILTNIANNLLPVQHLITGLAYVIGIAFAYKAIYSLKVYGEQRTMMSGSTNIKEPIVYLIVSGFLIYLPTGLDVALQTTFGGSNVLEYGYTGGHGGVADFIFSSGAGRALFIIMQTIGLIAFIRGWILIARSSSSGQQPGGTGKGLTHIIGGVLAINIQGTLSMINNTIYGT